MFSRIAAFLLLVVLLPLTTNAVPVEPDSAMEYIRQLSAPDVFQGRKSGTEAGNKAFFWMAEQFDRWGLEPLIGTDLTVPYDQLACIEKEGDIQLLDSRHGTVTYQLGDDFTVCTNSGSAQITAPVTIVGYGISKPEKGWNDYQNIDLEGRIAVVLRGSPPNGEQWEDERSRSYLYPLAIEHGAVAVLFYQNGRIINGASIQEDAYNPNVPTGYIGDKVLSDLLYGSGHTIGSYKRELRNGPFSLAVDRRLSIHFATERIEDAKGYNVVGVVEGTDESLKQEAVIIGAHGDHVGPNADGVLYLGADDNGSGAGSVMEMARAFAANPQPRTLIFCLFGAEEQGLLGSKALAPILPDTYNYITMLNLDMAGRGDGLTSIPGGSQIGEIWYPWYDSLPDSVQNQIIDGRPWGGHSSDHAPFRDEGIPVFSCSSRGHHDFYHASTDVFQTIHRPAIAGAVTYMSMFIEHLAAYPEPLAESYLKARTIWYRGSAIAWDHSSGDITTDLMKAEENRVNGFMGTILTLPTLYESTLLGYTDQFDAFDRLRLGTSLKDITSNARGSRGTLLLAIVADNLTDADSTNLRIWSKLGLSVLRVTNPHQWLVDHEALVNVIRKAGFIVETNYYEAEASVPLAEALPGQLIVVGSPGSFETTADWVPERLRELDAGIVLRGSASVLSAVPQEGDYIKTQVHVQPDEYSQQAALEWVDQLLKEDLYGSSEKVEIEDLIGGYMARW
ncbi:M28 family peptidase [bacterium]|nr:M28 family peptidase [bacterium]